MGILDATVARIQQSAGLYVKLQSLEPDDCWRRFLGVVERNRELAEKSEMNRMLNIVREISLEGKSI